MSLILKIATIAVVGYLVAVTALYVGQRRLIYHPTGTATDPATLGLDGFARVALTSLDGTTLETWRRDPQPGLQTILYFHGNGGTLADRAGRLAALGEVGYGVWIMAYRGYSGSDGRPSEARNTADARAFYDAAREQGISATDIVLYGESIGTGIATRLAADVEVGGLILDSPFTSLVDLAAELYPAVPVRPFIAESYPVASIIGEINAPLLVMHGKRDGVIPYRMGEAVHAAASAPKTLKIFPNGGHSDLFNHGALSEIRAFTANRARRED